MDNVSDIFSHPIDTAKEIGSDVLSGAKHWGGKARDWALGKPKAAPKPSASLAGAGKALESVGGATPSVKKPSSAAASPTTTAPKTPAAPRQRKGPGVGSESLYK